MKVLVIGSGGREHALVWKLSQSKKVSKIFCAPGNPGTSEICQNVPIDVNDANDLLAFAEKQKIDMTIVGPEVPLVSGIVDIFEKNGLSIIGPSKKAAQIEGSKIFAKNLMKKYGIPTASYETFSTFPKALAYIKTHKYPLVVKADGPCAGKGVSVCQSYKEAYDFLQSIMQDKIFEKSGNRVVIEECLVGPEVSFMVATDGTSFVSFLPSQDHKRAFDEDKGPNTGGMGAYAPVPFVDKVLVAKIEKDIVTPTIRALAKEGCKYKGILYPGLILTKDGPKVLEFNCRFGDPETQVLLLLLDSDIINIFDAIQIGKIEKLQLHWKKGSAVCVMLTAKGYPGIYEKGKEIKGVKKLSKDIVAFHSGTTQIENTTVSPGGRVIGITAVGKNLQNALSNVYTAIGKKGIYFSGMYYRKDIGRKDLESFGFVRPFARPGLAKLDYQSSGVNYESLDFVKRLAQKEGLTTAQNLHKDFFEIKESRGESAYVLKSGSGYVAFVQEGLGTKNVIADEMRKITGKTHYDTIAQDTVAAIVNDLLTVGARPVTVLAYWAVGNSNWFKDLKRAEDLVRGWKKACDVAGVVWGGGETPALSDIIHTDTIDLAGSAFGTVSKNHLIRGDIKIGDVIIFLGSSGICANGLTLIRKLADQLPDKYATKLVNGKRFGDELLVPTTIYSSVIADILDSGIRPSYMVNITGHGWRKLMRHPKSFTYVIETLPQKQLLFDFIQSQGNISDVEMYKTFNMGAGFALYVKKKDAEKVLALAKKNKITAWISGHVAKGEKQVIIEPLGIAFSSEDSNIR